MFLARPDDRLLDEAKSPGFGYLDRLICFSHFRLLSIWKNSCVVLHKNCGQEARRCSRSWLYVARQSWVRGSLCDQLRLSHCFGSFNPCLDRKCRSLAFLLCFSGWETRSDDLYFPSGTGKLNAFGIGAFALRHRPGEVPTISRKLRLKAGWSVNPTSNATVSKESFECNKRDFAASTRL